MRVFLLVVFFIPMTYLHSDEPLFQFTFGSNIKNFPLKIYKTNEKSLKQPFSVNLNEQAQSQSPDSSKGKIFRLNPLTPFDYLKAKKFSRAKTAQK